MSVQIPLGGGGDINTKHHLVPIYLITDQLQYNVNNLYFVLNFFLNISIPCYIFIKQVSLFVLWGVSTYNFMFYMIGK